MSEKLLSERDAYELVDILNAKGITEFARRAENTAHNEVIKKIRAMLGALPVWDDDILWLKVDKKLETLRKPEGGG